MSNWKDDGGGPAMPVPINKARFDTTPEDFEKTGMAGMTLRQYAAIHLCVPDSGVPELDAMIRTAKRDRLAQAAMQGLAEWRWNRESRLIAVGCYKLADAMMEAGK